MREVIIDIFYFIMGIDSSGRIEVNGIMKGIEDFYWEVMKFYNDGYFSVYLIYSYDVMNCEYFLDY